MSKKIGFWGVFALVVGSQIGSGVFTAPITLAPYGLWSLAGWLLSSVAALALAFVFGVLCQWIPKTGGPHAYVEEAFGKTTAFFAGWTYWVVSWVGITAVIMACVGYFGVFFKAENTSTVFSLLQFVTISLIAVLNIYGVKNASRIEVLLNILRLLPLVILPVMALSHFSFSHISLNPEFKNAPPSSLLGATALLTIWGFIGLETGSTPAGCVNNPKKNIPLAIILGTLCVAALYILNSIALLGLLPSEQFSLSTAPYADAAQFLFGPFWAHVVAVMAAIACLGSANAWMLASGQIALGLAQDRLLPQWFGKQNRHDAPVTALLLAYMGCAALLLLTQDKNFAKRLSEIVDISVIAFLFVYIISCLAMLKILKKKITQNETIPYAKSFLILAGLISLAFCIWVIAKTPFSVTAIACLFTLTGLPVYMGMKITRTKQKTTT